MHLGKMGMGGCLRLTNDNSLSIFATTIHELTHTAHWAIEMTTATYCSDAGQAGRLAESWAQMVGWFITKQVYVPAGLNPAGLNFTQFDQDAIQNRTLAIMGASGDCIINNNPWYTPLFIDLVDNHNQNTQNPTTFPVDNANGYTLQQLQSFLDARPTNWYMYRDYLQNNSSNPTEAAAVQLFSDYD